MIKENTPISMAEALEYAKDDKDLKGFVKNFTKITPEQAKEMRQEIEGLEILKIREKQVAKIINMLPEDKEELNNLLTDASLDEDESNKILEVIKKYK